MLDFDVQRCTRRCASSEREFAPGETFYSVLVSAGGQVVRYDYCEDEWQGPPDDSIGFWKSKMPEQNSTRINWAPNDVMLDYFERLEADVERQDVRYVLTLLLIRRRVLRLEETQTAVSGEEVMVLYCPRKETDYKLIVASPSRARVREVQQELIGLLFAEG